MEMRMAMTWIRVVKSWGVGVEKKAKGNVQRT